MSSGRTIAVGDIHGCDVALETLLKLVDPQPDDLVVILGDVIDRGPDTRRCIDQLLDLRNRCRVVSLMGNHEEIFLDVLSGGRRWAQTWPNFGGLEMLASYGGSMENIPPDHLEFLRSGKDFYETDSEIFVHALLRPQMPPELEEAAYLRWARFPAGGLEAHVSGRRLICGHTAQKGGKPDGNPASVCIDTCAYCPSGFLSALETGTDTLWQAGQSGVTRGPMPLAEAL